MLERKISHPGVSNMTGGSVEGALFSAIISLITQDEEQNPTVRYS